MRLLIRELIRARDDVTFGLVVLVDVVVAPEVGAGLGAPEGGGNGPDTGTAT